MIVSVNQHKRNIFTSICGIFLLQFANFFNLKKMIIYENKTPRFDFQIKNIGNGVIEVSQYEAALYNITNYKWTVNGLKEPTKEDYERLDSAKLLRKKIVRFDCIQIANNDYTKNRLSVYLWYKNNNVLSGDMDFLPISDLQYLLYFIDYELTKKQESSLVKMIENYCKLRKVEVFKFSQA